MNKYVAFLRAINVAGHTKVKMSDLKGAFLAVGCKDVTTYIQTGNVIFSAVEGEMASLGKKIQTKLNRLLDAKVTILFKTRQELEDILREAPFKDMESNPDLKLYVVFLTKKPPKNLKFPLVSSKEALEAVKMKHLEVYIVSRPKKSGWYGFPNNFIEKVLGVPATTRNWSTIKKIADLLS